MTDRQINIAIAALCGWTNIMPCTCAKDLPRGKSPNGNYGHIPVYTHDLNEMHEAEKIFWLWDARCEIPKSRAKNEANEYFGNLKQVCRVSGVHPIHASARERAEAFLKTLGKWKEVQG